MYDELDVRELFFIVLRFKVWVLVIGVFFKIFYLFLLKLLLDECFRLRFFGWFEM